MLKHNLLLFFRSIIRHRTNFMIIISGMILGLTALLLANTFISDEKGFDRMHSNGDRIFRVNKWDTDPGGDRKKMAESPGLMAGELFAGFPEVESVTRIVPWFDEVLISYKEKNIKVGKFVFADSNFFRFFNFRLLAGDPAKVLSEPGQVVLTSSLARTVFGNADPVGQAFKGLDDKLFTVSGIIEDAPRQSHIQYEAICSWASTQSNSNFLDFSFMNNWLAQAAYTYVKLHEPGQMAAVNKKLPAFTAQFMPNRTTMYEFYLQPLSEIYLHSSDITLLRGGKYGRSSFLSIFTIISIIILAIACFNYINITTAQLLQRAKEVGIKKVLGAGRSKLLVQFLLETFITMVFAAILAAVLAQLLLPVLNTWFEKDIPQYKLLEPGTIGFLLLVVILTSLLSGFFPGLLLSKFKPVSILKSTTKFSPGTQLPRQILVTAQLCISIGLITGTIVLHQQFRYLLNRDMGFDKDQLMVLKTAPGVKENLTAFGTELRSLPGIKSVSICQAAMPEGTFGTTVIPEGSNGKEIPVREFRVDSNYLVTYGLEMAKGRFLNRGADNTAGGLVVNETLVKQMGWEEPVGKIIQFAGSEARVPVVGVVKDFNFNSLHEAVTPVIMYLNNRTSNISVRFDSRQLGTLLPVLQKLWQKYEPRYPFEYSFLDEYFARNYIKEKQLVNIITLFAAVAIIIACLGLYGLASFAISKRIKEIGIRKVLGASVSGILVLLSKNFLKPVAIALVIITPVIWYVINRWLENFAFHIQPQWWLFLVAGIIMTVIVLFAVGFQAIKAAIANPVKSLRTE